MTALQSSVGFFGKLPSNGDFLQRRVPQDFLDIWDPWLQDCVQASRHALGESWLDRYLTSPLWRFVLSSSVCGSGAYAGVLAPSVDRVGRYFPLTVVAQIDVDISPLQFALDCTAWFESIEWLVLDALEQPSVDLKEFDAAIAALAQPLDECKPAAERAALALYERSRFPARGGAWRAPLESALDLQRAVNRLAQRTLSDGLRPVSLWWTEGSAAIAPSWLSLRGLPQPAHYAGMLDGGWTAAGWDDLGDLPHPQTTRRAPAPARVDPDPAALLIDADSPAAGSAADAGAVAPRTQVPDVQLAAVETNRAAFLVRPELGLWGVAATADPFADPTTVRLIADGLQQLGPAASLTALVEAVRRVLAEVHQRSRQLATRDVQRVASSGNAAVLLIAGGECALVAAGDVQVLRVQDRRLEPVGALHDAALHDTALGGGAFQDPAVHYAACGAGDQWVLSARALLSGDDVARLAAMAAGGLPLNLDMIAVSLDPLSYAGGALPMLTVEI